MLAMVTVHGLWRWVVLVAALLAIAGSKIAPDSGSGEWGGRTGLFYSVALDLQVLIGLVLWVLEAGWRLNPFFAYIHPVTMLLALSVAHAGRGRQKSTGALSAGFWFYIASVGLVLLGIPR